MTDRQVSDERIAALMRDCGIVGPDWQMKINSSHVADLCAALTSERAANAELRQIIANREIDIPAKNTTIARLTAERDAAIAKATDFEKSLHIAHQTVGDLETALGKAQGAIADLEARLASERQWLDEKLTTEIKTQLSHGGQIGVLRFARELLAVLRSRAPVEKKEG